MWLDKFFLPKLKNEINSLSSIAVTSQFTDIPVLPTRSVSGPTTSQLYYFLIITRFFPFLVTTLNNFKVVLIRH